MSASIAWEKSGSAASIGPSSRRLRCESCSVSMARPRKRVCLQDGLKLDLNRLIRDGTVKIGAATSRTIFWQVAGSREVVRVAVITADLTNFASARIWVLMRGLDQKIELIAQPRSFGGRQWYFLCPVWRLPASVLWKPPGATKFRSRQAWGKEVAYHTQFVGREGRARIGKQRTRSRLGSDDKDSNWHLPPPAKPKWMRWPTYERHLNKYLDYEQTVLKVYAAWAVKLSAMLAAK